MNETAGTWESVADRLKRDPLSGPILRSKIVYCADVLGPGLETNVFGLSMCGAAGWRASMDDLYATRERIRQEYGE